MDFVLENNNFTFNGEHYVQTEGTAIGSKMGCNYACTYMGEWEEQLLERSALKPVVFLRYIDDIFGVWQHGEEALMDFQKTANEIHKNILVELRYSDSELEFLDVLTKVENNEITSDLYEKETNSHSYLHASSSHPQHIKNSIAYGLSVRAKRICAQEKDFKKHQQEIIQHMTKCGHNRKQVIKQVNRVNTIQRKDLFENKIADKSNKIPLLLNFSKALPNINEIIRK